jgi:hypothetical protein
VLSAVPCKVTLLCRLNTAKLIKLSKDAEQITSLRLKGKAYVAVNKIGTLVTSVGFLSMLALMYMIWNSCIQPLFFLFAYPQM